MKRPREQADQRTSLQYLFAAIDARQARAKEQRAASHATRPPRARFNPDELKRLVVEASEAVDDKSAANDFQETLERIVGEIRNTTEHSGAFLQKVRKADVPDYYDVIKRPMDLATLLKKVKQQAYRTKKAFAEDLDLIWSNCLLYNSHPNHPLRHSAEFLRAKSNQLLEFITDPALSQRSLLAASLSSAALDARRGNSARVGTPDEDADADGESDEDGGRSKRALSERLLNGVNGDEPTPPPPHFPFEEHAAFVRTPHSMHEFLLLDQELSKLEGNGFRPIRSSVALPPSAFEPAPSTSSLAVAKPKSRAKSRVNTLVRHLHPEALPGPASPAPALTAASSRAATPSASEPSTPAAPPPALAPLPPRDPNDPLEAIWWDVVAPVRSSAQLYHPSTSAVPAAVPEPGADGINGHGPASAAGPAKLIQGAAPALVAGMPHVPWVGFTASPFVTSSGVSAASGGTAKGKGRAAAGKRTSKGLGVRMRRNCETLRRIRRVGDTLARESTAADLESPTVSDGDFSDLSDNEPNVAAMEVDHPPKRRRRTPQRPKSLVRAQTIPREAMRCPATAPDAAREALRAVGAGVLEHAGFEGASGGALDVLGHLAGEYITNLGRTLRFYVDRYGNDLSERRILNQALAENGVPSPSHLSSHVSEDIDRYGARLNDTLSKLERARQEQLEGLSADDLARADSADEALFANDGEAFLTGDWAHKLGDDFFGLNALGLDQELAVQNLVLPKWLLRGEARPHDNESTSSTLAYSPPPSFIPLTPDAISSQIGILRPYFTLRAALPALGLTEDLSSSALALSGLPSSSSRSKTGTRHKVPPHGRIPFKGKKRPDDPTLPSALAAQLAGLNEPPKKKRKKAVAVEDAVVDSGGE
ncbi:hypothetical protein Rhopal_004844-T1 [Rhodotorula paludigena]|uniref:Bromo domain-containing protein n=1 Tax=Rhodotorula paludigena TaxID=86838 RepID=A0AAV5GGX3_9BASI|nr:hypothetical protein Rhopal_004844-T1 [Rhodotorula paludigena]